MIIFPAYLNTTPYRWNLLPYTLEPVGADRWVLLNRRYKPLGTVSEQHVDYEPYAMTLPLTPADIQPVDWRTPDVLLTAQWPHNVFLYADHCSPHVQQQNAHYRRAYAERCKALQALLPPAVPCAFPLLSPSW